MRGKIFKYPGFLVFYLLGGAVLCFGLYLLILHMISGLNDESLSGAISFVIASVTFILCGTLWINIKKGAPGSLLVGFLIALVVSVTIFAFSFEATYDLLDDGFSEFTGPTSNTR